MNKYSNTAPLFIEWKYLKGQNTKTPHLLLELKGLVRAKKLLMK